MYIQHKYCFKKHLAECVKSTGGSSTWHHLLQAKYQTEPGLKWIVSEGNINFWYDQWFIEGKLGKRIDVSVDL